MLAPDMTRTAISQSVRLSVRLRWKTNQANQSEQGSTFRHGTWDTRSSRAEKNEYLGRVSYELGDSRRCGSGAYEAVESGHRLGEFSRSNLTESKSKTQGFGRGGGSGGGGGRQPEKKNRTEGHLKSYEADTLSSV